MMRRWSAALALAAMTLPLGQGPVGLAMSAFHHDHDHEGQLPRALQTALHGHSHDADVPAHDHLFSPARPDVATHGAGRDTWRAVASVSSFNPAGEPRDRMPLTGTMESHGPGPPAVSRRSPVLRI
jgi:hypothetical protein